MVFGVESSTRSSWKVASIGLLATLYGVMFLVLQPHMSYGAAPFGAATVIIAGRFFGIRGGLITTAFVSIENLMLFHFFLDRRWFLALTQGNVAGLISLFLIAGAIGHMSDLSRKVKEYAQLLQHEAFHDSLTNLPNRSLFYDRLEHAMERVTRGTSSIALLFIDLDGFKQINDRYGHLVGDRLLATVAERLRANLRSGDTLARLGGDEFVILLEDLVDVNVARQAAERLVRQLESPFSIENSAVTMTASIGIAFHEAGASEAEDLLFDADRAMYQAKAAGKARYEIFQRVAACTSTEPDTRGTQPRSPVVWVR